MKIELGRFALCPSCKHWMRFESYSFCRGCGRTWQGAASWPATSTTLEVAYIPECEMGEYVPLNEMKVLREITIDMIWQKWEQIKHDVAALDKQIGAMLAVCDPSSVGDTVIVLSAPYEFHRSELNKRAEKTVLEDVMARLLGRRMIVDVRLPLEGVQP